MSRIGVRLGRVLSGVALGLALGLPSAALAQEIPPAPDPVPVMVDPATTAYLVLDITDAICGASEACRATVPADMRMLQKARAANVLVVYSMGRAPQQVLPDVAPLPDDPVVRGPADKFFSSDLDSILSSHGIKTVVIVGTAANGAPLYTAFEANIRGYKAIVAVDGIPMGDPVASGVTLWQLLNEPGFSNPGNDPVATTGVTLSRSDLIAFGAPGGK